MTNTDRSALEHLYKAGKVHTSEGLYAFKQDGTAHKTTCFGRLWSKITGCCTSRRSKEIKSQNILSHIENQSQRLRLEALPLTRQAILNHALKSAELHLPPQSDPPTETTIEISEEENYSPPTQSLEDSPSADESEITSDSRHIVDDRREEEKVVDKPYTPPTPVYASEREVSEQLGKIITSEDSGLPLTAVITCFNPSDVQPISLSKKQTDKLLQIFSDHVKEINRRNSRTTTTFFSTKEGSSPIVSRHMPAYINESFGSELITKKNNTSEDRGTSQEIDRDESAESKTAKEVLISSSSSEDEPFLVAAEKDSLE